MSSGVRPAVSRPQSGCRAWNSDPVCPFPALLPVRAPGRPGSRTGLRPRQASPAPQASLTRVTAPSAECPTPRWHEIDRCTWSHGSCAGSREYEGRNGLTMPQLRRRFCVPDLAVGQLQRDRIHRRDVCAGDPLPLPRHAHTRPVPPAPSAASGG